MSKYTVMCDEIRRKLKYGHIEAKITFVNYDGEWQGDINNWHFGDDEDGRPYDGKTAAENALDEIARMCGCANWEYPGQVVRDVRDALAIISVPLGEYKAIGDTIQAARNVQTFLWGEANGAWGLEEWRRMFRKRVAKLDSVSLDNPHAEVEVKKRLLQTAALAVALIKIISEDGIPSRSESAPPSDLPEFDKPIYAVDGVIVRKGLISKAAAYPHTRQTSNGDDGCWSVAREYREYKAWPILFALAKHLRGVIDISLVDGDAICQDCGDSGKYKAETAIPGLVQFEDDDLVNVTELANSIDWQSMKIPKELLEKP